MRRLNEVPPRTPFARRWPNPPGTSRMRGTHARRSSRKTGSFRAPAHAPRRLCLVLWSHPQPGFAASRDAALMCGRARIREPVLAPAPPRLEPAVHGQDAHTVPLRYAWSHACSERRFTTNAGRMWAANSANDIADVWRACDEVLPDGVGWAVRAVTRASTRSPPCKPFEDKIAV
jgi:hypothetical protein